MMNYFTTISYLVLYGLSFLCFLIPFANGHKRTGTTAGIALAAFVTLTAIGNVDMAAILIWPFIFAFQIIFLIYWVFRIFQRRKLGQVVATVLTVALIVLVMQHWISDWMFSKKDVRKILAYHSLELKDDFKIVENESGGLRDFYETFTVKLSDDDFNRITREIRTSKNYRGFFKGYADLPSASHDSLDTIEFETENHLEREYFTHNKMENGTHHFIFQLHKQRKELSYIGADE